MKISGVKRSQHIKHKKNFAKPGKKKDAIKNNKTIEKQLASSKKVFGKPIGQKSGKRKEIKSEGAQNGRGPKKGRNVKNSAQSEKPSTNGGPVSEENEMNEEDIRDLLDMIEDEDDELLNRSKKRKRDENNAVDDDNAGQFEQEYAFQRNEEKSKKTRTVDLLPIKTKFGELITRQTEVDIKEKPKKVDQEGDESDDGEEEVIDSDDDIVNDLQSEQQELIAAAKDKAISTADLLILREQELNRQKYRIGIICSGILEKPEDKMKNFNALFELMDERHNDAPNLFSVRKIATMSLLEVFKDILPEYRIGQIDLKTQQGNCFCQSFTFEIIPFLSTTKILTIRFFQRRISDNIS